MQIAGMNFQTRSGLLSG
ncbi:MAG: hypothetical protein ACLR6S_05365 [Lacrimispora saccharolytica]